MMTVRSKKETAGAAMSMSGGGMAMSGGEMSDMSMPLAGKPSPPVATMTALSFVALAAGLALAFAT